MIPIFFDGPSTPEKGEEYIAWQQASANLPRVWVTHARHDAGFDMWKVALDYCSVFDTQVDAYYGAGTYVWFEKDAAYYSMLGRLMAFLTAQVAVDDAPDFHIGYSDTPTFTMETTAYELAQIHEIARNAERSLPAYRQLVDDTLPWLSASVTDLQTGNEVQPVRVVSQ